MNMSPFSKLASSIMSLGQSQKNLMVHPSVDSQLNVWEPSWSQVRKQLESQQTTVEEKEYRNNLAKGYGEGSPLHTVRLYDPSTPVEEKDIRVTLYRDSASWCPYCQKVWMALEYKQIPYKVEKINMRCYGDKPASFTRLQPSGQIPVAIIDGKTYRQSNDILYQLEQDFPNHPSLTPWEQQQDPKLSSRANDLLRLERQLFSAWMYWLTTVDYGGNSLRKSFEQVLQQVEQALSSSDGPFFLGSQFSLVDVQFAPFLERMAASLLYYKGFQIRVVPTDNKNNNRYPNINRWFDAMEEIPAYILTKSDYYTHCWDLPPQLGGCGSEPGCEKYQAAINGQDGTSWELPLQPHNGGIEPDWNHPTSQITALARREAVERVTANANAIVAFAARGVSPSGFPPVSAPLADPNAIPSPAVQPGVGAVLRTVCTALLSYNTDEQNVPDTISHQKMQSLAQYLLQNGGIEYTQGICLEHGTS
jgi:glutathione S-transferase